MVFMKINQKNIYFILLESKHGQSVKELLISLNQKKSKKAQVRKVLRLLTSQELTYKKNNHYHSKESMEAESKKRFSAQLVKPTTVHRFFGVFLRKQKEIIIRDLHSSEIKSISKKDANFLMHGDEIEYSQPKKSKYSVKIHRIIRRKNQTLRGTLVTKGKEILFRPSNKHFIQEFRVKKETIVKTIKNQAVIVKITKYPAPNIVPEAIVISHIHSDFDEKSEILAILAEHKISEEFPESLNTYCDKLPKQIKLSKSENRKDLRTLHFITIDGEDAKDFDDAIYAQKEGDFMRIWISIADVSEYVPPKSLMDSEAFKRATSAYFPGKVYPMLPNVLSNHLCSIKPGVNRKTLTCEILIDLQGKPVECKIYESLMLSRARLTYGEVDQFFLTGKLKPRLKMPELGNQLNLYLKISQILKKKRKDRGVFQFNFPEAFFEYNSNGKLVNVRKHYQTESMTLIEQFMLEANENVSLFCVKNKISVLWRNHDAPSNEKLKDLKEFLSKIGMKNVKLNSQADLNKILTKTHQYKNREWLEYNVLRCLTQAYYSTYQKGHYGLASPNYLHFTSPIRRYPDLCTHRNLKNWLNKGKISNLHKSVGDWVSQKERNAASAEKKATKLKKMLFLSDSMGEVFKARVTGVHWNGIFIELESVYIEGFIPMNFLSDDYYLYQESSQSLLGKRTKKQIFNGIKMQAILTRLDFRHRSPEFELKEWL